MHNDVAGVYVLIGGEEGPQVECASTVMFGQGDTMYHVFSHVTLLHFFCRGQGKA